MPNDPGLLPPDPAPPPGAVRYSQMVDAAGADTADAWLSDQEGAMTKSGWKPSEIDAYFGRSQPDKPPPPSSPLHPNIWNTVQQNVQRALEVPVDAQKIASNPLEALQAGFDFSATGMVQNKGARPTVMDPKAGFLSRLAFAAGNMAGDLPYNYLGAVAGGAGGAAIPGAGETGVSETLGVGFGAFAMPRAVREVMQDAHNAHRDMTPQQIAQMVGQSTTNTVQEGVTGALSTLVGGKIGATVIKAGAKPVIAGLANAGGMYATSTAATAAMHAQMPTKSDLAIGAVLVLGPAAAMHVAPGGHASPKLTPDGERVAKNMGDAYRELNIPPWESGHAAGQDPVLHDEIIGQDHQGNPNLAKHRILANNEPASYKPRVPDQELVEPGQVPGGLRNVTPPKPPLNAEKVIPLIEGGLSKTGQPLVSPKGAIGEYQIMPGTARQYMGSNFDVSTLKDPAVQKQVYGRIMADLERRYPNDPEAQLVAYNAGPGVAGKYLNFGPGSRLKATPDPLMRGGIRYDQEPSDRDEMHLPYETQKYLANARRKGGEAPGHEEAAELPGHTGIPSWEAQEEALEPEGESSVGAQKTAWDEMSYEDQRDSVNALIGEQPKPGGWKPGEALDWLSELSPAKRVDLAMQKTGSYDQKTQMGFEDWMRWGNGAPDRASLMIYDGIVDAKTNTATPDTPSIKSILYSDGVKGDWEGFNARLMAERAMQKSQQGIETGMDPALAEAVATSPEWTAKFGAAVEQWQQMDRGFVHYMRDRGLYSETRADAMIGLNQTHVPFRRVAGDEKSFTGTGRFTMRDPMHRMLGDDGQVINPLLAKIDNMRVGTIMADRNFARAQIVDMAQKDPAFAATAGIQVRPFTDDLSTQLDEALKRYGFKDAELASAREAYYPIVAQREEAKLDPSEFLVFQSGTPYKVKVDNPAIADMFRAVSGIEDGNMVMKAAQAINKITRVGLASPLNPPFMIGTFTWHQMNRYVLDDMPEMFPGQDAIRGFMHSFLSDDVFKRVQGLGGLGGDMTDIYHSSMVRDIDQTFRETSVFDKAWNTFQSGYDLMDWMHSRLWAAPRIGAVLRYEEAGIDPNKAAMKARQTGLDMTQRTASSTVNYVSKADLFLQTTLRGAEQVTNAFSSPKRAAITTARVLGLMTAPALVLALLARSQDQFLDPHDRYSEIPDWEKDHYMIGPMINGQRPKLRFYGGQLGYLFGALPVRILNTIADADPVGYKEIASHALEAILPQTMGMPSIFKTPIELLTNHNFNTGHALVSDSQMRLSGPLQMNENTTAPAKALAKWMNPLLTPIGQQASPIAIEHVISDWGGPVGMGVLHALDFNGKFQPPSELADNPFFKSFLLRNPGMSAKSIEDFYDTRTDFERAHADFLATAKRVQTGDATVQDLQNVSMNPDLVRTLSGIDKAAKALDYMRQAVDGIDKSDMLPAEKRQYTDKLADMAISVAKYAHAEMTRQPDKATAAQTDVQTAQPGAEQAVQALEQARGQ